MTPPAWQPPSVASYQDPLGRKGGITLAWTYQSRSQARCFSIESTSTVELSRLENSDYNNAETETFTAATPPVSGTIGFFRPIYIEPANEESRR
ncbi:hypothetical protein N7481_002078 [Penicillium waksmanii]|uniref:uncharacterized protein n=1 Tax=Penicillium waksmanii TaxID=69791 RepID=UPI002547616D|nr:uncharacterized protein N7481_002078 [Penicillium waksmanii]KAJ5995101.1 hypothetical protein N7481_002078 [Penicillium waksmanii]